MNVEYLRKYFQNVTKSRFFRHGLPFVLLIVGGSFGLQQFAEIRYTFRKSDKMSFKEAEELGLMTGPPRSSEEIYEEMKKSNTDNWENIRGPRPWEDSKTVQDAQRKKRGIFYFW